MDKPTIVITGQPQWAQTVADTLGTNYRVVNQTQPEGYMKTLIESLAAMILVDGDAANWETWVSTPKASPATRRIPIVLVSDDSEKRATAPLVGADVTVSKDELLNGLLKLVSDFARVRDPEIIKQLDCECQEALPLLAQEGVRKFNAGEYYKQHDLFEEQWMNTETPVRDLYRAVLQVGVSYFQIQRGNYRGALKMLQRSVQWLVVLPDVCQGINIKKLREDSFRVRAELERLGEQRLHEFDMSLIHDVELVAPIP
jgi:predicted metal-dependent hydrolase